ncbi:MAG: integrase [Pirellulaceae bacterium]|jgi:integrase
MPKTRQAIIVECRYFVWRLRERNGVWQADGRSNELDAGRHSLGVKEEDDARKLVHQLDAVQAAKLGLIDRIPEAPESGLTIKKGIELFRKHKSRPKSVGGVEPSTFGRYNQVLNKFISFAIDRRIKYASQLSVLDFDAYVGTLEEKEFSLSSIVTEMVLLKSLHQFWIDENRLDAKFGFKYPLRRPKQSLTFSPSQHEIDAILKICREDETLVWLYRATSLLSFAGLRFGEARDLEWRDIDRDYEFLKVRDESFMKRSGETKKRTTKTRKSRKVPIHRELAELLKSIPRTGNHILYGPRGGKLRNDTFGDTLRAHVLPKVAEDVGNKDVMRLTAHGFRHYFVSKCANLNVPQLSVMNWLGHGTPRMTNYYYHANDAASLSHMRQLESAESPDHGGSDD